MKLLSSRRHVASAQILAEAAIGLSLMTFAWILIAYSLYLANYKIRTAMAARYAAWYQANNGGTAATPAQLDQYFFYQSGLSSVSNLDAILIGEVIEGDLPTNSADVSGDDSQPFRSQVSFGVTSLDNSANPFPFNLLNSNVKVPLMPSSTLSTFSVNSFCQWDDDSDCWTNAEQAASGAWNALMKDLGSFFSGS
jgi:hypothetical protein